MQILPQQACSGTYFFAFFGCGSLCFSAEISSSSRKPGQLDDEVDVSESVAAVLSFRFRVPLEREAAGMRRECLVLIGHNPNKERRCSHRASVSDLSIRCDIRVQINFVRCAEVLGAMNTKTRAISCVTALCEDGSQDPLISTSPNTCSAVDS